MTEFPMTIGGHSTAAASTFDVVNPATGEVVGAAPDATEVELDQAMRAAQDAWASWRGDVGVRRAALHAIADLLGQHKDELTGLLTAEQGKPLHEADEEIRDSQAWLRYYAELDDPVVVLQDDDRARIEVRRRPLGVVAAITPWNYPVTLASWKFGPALLAGNTVVLKPSPFTPLATLRLGQLANQVLPPGVLNVVSGQDHLGPLITRHPVPRKISFTGSVATGKHVAASAADDLKRITLELGGNDPAIVLDDVDVQSVAESIFWRAFENNGQVCSAIKRVYAPEPLYDDLVEALAAIARTATVGNGALPGTQLGPINNRPQLTRVSSLVAEALSQGAKAAAGGSPIEGAGYFFEPTILRDAQPGMRIVDEEQFGPVLPVIRYADVAEVVADVNGSPYGLCGSVWSADEERAAAIAETLDVGTAWTNTHLAFQPDQPFGGAKWSGIGVENGVWGLHGFSDVQVIHRARR